MKQNVIINTQPQQKGQTPEAAALFLPRGSYACSAENHNKTARFRCPERNQKVYTLECGSPFWSQDIAGNGRRMVSLESQSTR